MFTFVYHSIHFLFNFLTTNEKKKKKNKLNFILNKNELKQLRKEKENKRKQLKKLFYPDN